MPRKFKTEWCVRSGLDVLAIFAIAGIVVLITATLHNANTAKRIDQARTICVR